MRKSISQVPLYDRDSLTRYVEKRHSAKRRRLLPKRVSPTLAKEESCTKLPANRRSIPFPREAVDLKTGPTHPSQSARKDVAGSNTGGVNADARVATPKPTQAMRPQEHTDARHQDRVDLRPQERADSRPQERADTRPFEARTSVPATQSAHLAGIDQRGR